LESGLCIDQSRRANQERGVVGIKSHFAAQRLSFRRVASWLAATSAFVAVGVAPVIMLASPASALNSPESDCLSLIGGGTAGSNFSTTAACERAASSTTWYIGGYNTGSAFTGHLEFLFGGDFVINASVSGEVTYGSAAYSLGYQSTSCPGNWQTILWRDNGGGNYTNMGEAQIAVTCDTPNSPKTNTSMVTVRRLSRSA